LSDPWFGPGRLPVYRSRSDDKLDDFRCKLVQSEYDFHRKEFYASHSPIFLGVSFAANIAIATYVWTNRQPLVAYIEQQTSGQQTSPIILPLLLYVFIVLLIIVNVTRYTVLRRKWIENFVVEQIYDEHFRFRGAPFSNEDARKRAQAELIDLMEQRLQWLRETNTRRRGAHRQTNVYLIISLILGLSLMIIERWPYDSNGPLEFVDVIRGCEKAACSVSE
jgi:hypothetical protein